MKRKYILFLILLLIIFNSCAQDSIFADIAVEPPPIDPRIAGSSTNIVIFNDGVYMASVGSNTIHVYSMDQWNTFNAGGRIVGLAATSSKLYALIYYGDDRLDTALVEWDGNEWTTIDKGDANSFSIQSIYGTGERLFAGGRTGNSWDVFHLENNRLSRLISNSSPLTGAASIGSDYYISTGGRGIYRASSPGAPIAGSETNVTGIINVNGTIAAVTWDGRVLVNTGSQFVTRSEDGANYTGAMAVYTQGNRSFLLIGVQSSGNYNRGYRELVLDNGLMPTDDRRPVIPGGENSSVSPENKSKYEASLARFSVHYIIQVPGEPLIFASTSGRGVYVLRDGLWNAQG